MTFLVARSPNERRRAAILQERQRAIMERRAFGSIYRILRESSSIAAQVYEATGSVSAVNTRLAELEARLTAVLGPIYRESISRVHTRFLQEVTALREKKDAAGAADRLIQEWVHSYSAKKVTSIANTTRKLIVQAIDIATQEGMGQRATAKLIREKTGGRIARSRAETIARTETHAAAQTASLELVKTYEIPLKKMWVTVEDERTRESHSHADGQKVDIDQPFDINGEALMYPGDQTASPSETINCRCVMIYEE